MWDCLASQVQFSLLLDDVYHIFVLQFVVEPDFLPSGMLGTGSPNYCTVKRAVLRCGGSD
jgi:hypothetical protein